jgi:hypothetical protein
MDAVTVRFSNSCQLDQLPLQRYQEYPGGKHSQLRPDGGHPKTGATGVQFTERTGKIDQIRER